eukprot:2324516-Rhodomonas_salina.1
MARVFALPQPRSCLDHILASVQLEGLPSFPDQNGLMVRPGRWRQVSAAGGVWGIDYCTYHRCASFCAVSQRRARVVRKLRGGASVR